MLQGRCDAVSRLLLLVVVLLLAMAVGPLPAPASAAITGERTEGVYDYDAFVVTRADVHGVLSHEGGPTQILHLEEGMVPTAVAGSAATCDCDAPVEARAGTHEGAAAGGAIAQVVGIEAGAPGPAAEVAGAATTPLLLTGTPSAASLVDDTVRMADDWLGPNVRAITNRSGDKVFLSEDGLRRIRFDMRNPTPYSSPHAHVEEFVNGRWVKSGPIFPTDVPPR